VRGRGRGRVRVRVRVAHLGQDLVRKGLAQRGEGLERHTLDLIVTG
jgi:hypothetical protein